MNEELSNPKLFDQKLNNLYNFENNLNTSLFAYSLCCHYHGIPLHFQSKSQKFITELKKIIPAEWITNTKFESIIYLLSPSEFGFTIESFSDESSQDCITKENNTIAIQRDFAAKIVEKKVLLLCEEEMSDGLYNFLRWFLSEKLMEINSFVVHASCVLDKESKAHLFLGHSNAGKTTITELSSPRLVLGDDMNLISVENGQLYAEAGAIGGRFNSMIGYGKKVPLKAIYWLHQDKINGKIELDALTSTQYLLASFANLHWPTLPSEKIEKLIDFSEKATNTVKFYQLNFKKESSIWELLDP